MKKQVFVVSLTYFFEGDIDNETYLFDTYNKAKSFFDTLVEKEKTQTWIADYDDVDITHEPDYFHAFENSNYYETSIRIKKQDILWKNTHY